MLMTLLCRGQTLREESDILSLTLRGEVLRQLVHIWTADAAVLVYAREQELHQVRQAEEMSHCECA
jgi:hypothetical protein